VRSGDRIYEKLRETGKKESDLAEKLGISTEQMSKWKGNRSSPKPEYLPVICEFLQVSYDWLLTGAEKKPPSTYTASAISSGMVMQGTSNNGTIIITGVNGEKTITLSPEILELIRIYDSLPVRERHNLMDEAFRLDDSRK